jgi:photosystem II stability/assembly factor-like uncharacterized protein
MTKTQDISWETALKICCREVIKMLHASVVSIRTLCIIVIVMGPGSTWVTSQVSMTMKMPRVERSASKLLDKSEAVKAIISPVSKMGHGVEASFFANEATWWVIIRNTVNFTEDGGRTWRTTELPNTIAGTSKKIQFWDGIHGMLLAQTNETENILDSGKNKYWFLESKDSGKSWQLLASESGVFVSSILFTDNEKVWLGGRRFIGISPVRFDAFLAHRTDGGKHWEDFSGKMVNLLSSNEYIAAAILRQGGLINIISTDNRVIESQDDGRSWRIATSFRDVPERNVYFKSDERSGTWLAGNINAHGLQIGTLMTKKTDQLWQMNMLNMAHFTDIINPTEGKFFACGTIQEFLDPSDTSKTKETGVILESVDLGKSWSTLYKSNGNEFLSLYYLNDETILMLNKNGDLSRLKLH